MAVPYTRQRNGIRCIHRLLDPEALRGAVVKRGVVDALASKKNEVRGIHFLSLEAAVLGIRFAPLVS
jgi:hypothetical protein